MLDNTFINLLHKLFGLEFKQTTFYYVVLGSSPPEIICPFVYKGSFLTSCQELPFPSCPHQREAIIFKKNLHPVKNPPSHP